MVVAHLALLGWIAGADDWQHHDPASRAAPLRSGTTPGHTFTVRQVPPGGPAAGAAGPAITATPSPARSPAPSPARSPAAARALAAGQPAMPPAASAPPAATASADATPAPERQAVAGAAPSSAAGPSVPTYSTRLPPAATLHYALNHTLQRGLARGQAQLRWASDGSRYTLDLSLGGFERELPGRRSSGVVDRHGLAPERHAETRRGREQRAASFERDGSGGGRVRFSATGTEQPLPPGAQDRLSWMLQLAAIVAADPARAEPGQRIDIFVVGARGDAETWRFEAIGQEPVELGDGRTLAALQLRREPRRPYDTTAQVWLAPEHGYLPVRARLFVRPTGEGTDFVLERIEQP